MFIETSVKEAAVRHKICKKGSKSIVMSKLLTILAFVLVMGTNTHQISSVETRGGWVRLYDEKGHNYKTLSVSTVGEVKGYSSTLIVTQNHGWIYLLDAEGKKYQTKSASIVGEVLGVAGDTFTSRNGGWIYTWDRNGKKISTRAAR